MAMAAMLAEMFYDLALLALLVLTVLLAWAARPSTSDALPRGFTSFMLTYLGVWTLASFGDWMQGPYLYDLYDSYGFEHQQIERLLVAGFSSSGIFGCVAGALIDKYGRKKSCMMYCVLYILSCASMHFHSFGVLLVGRVLGGLATSLLFSSFECWMVSEHLQRHEFSGSLLGFMFGFMFFAMYCVGIASGLVGQLVTGISSFGAWSDDSKFHTGGAIWAFDFAIVCLFVALVLIAMLFEENYGSQGGARSAEASGQVVRDGLPLLVPLGGVVSIFEASMFVFVSEWFRCIVRFDFQPKIGLLFSMFMMACLCGASATTLLGKSLRPTQRLAFAFTASFFAFCVAAVGVTSPKDSTVGAICVFAAFLVFEFNVGVYFPTAGVLKSDIVPEEIRGTVYNLYRLPLNIIVVVMLLSGFDSVTKFQILALLMLVGLGCIAAISTIRARDGGRELGRKLQEANGQELAERV